MACLRWLNAGSGQRAFFFADGSLMFQQVPLVEIDGMKLVQTKAILHYIAEKYNLHGKDIKERAMYAPLL